MRVITDRSDPNFDPRMPGAIPGRRRRYVLTILGSGGCGREFRSHSYPHVTFRTRDAIYFASQSLVYTVVPWEEPNERGWSEIAWTTLGNIRLWGAVAFSIVEGRGFYSFYPLDSLELYVGNLEDEQKYHRVAERLVGRNEPRKLDLHWVKPRVDEIGALYDELLKADNVLLRGVSCYLKAHLLWGYPFFDEEMAINLYIALEAGLSVIRQRLSADAGRTVSFRDVFDFVRLTFAYGEGLAEYWEDVHDDRNALLHPANDFRPYVIQPMSADDVLELYDPMLSLYRFLLIGDPRPAEIR